MSRSVRLIDTMKTTDFGLLVTTVFVFGLILGVSGLRPVIAIPAVVWLGSTVSVLIVWRRMKRDHSDG